MSDINTARNLGVFYPLLHVCLSISGPTLGILLSKENPSYPVIAAFFVPLSAFLICYAYVLSRKTHLLLNSPERHAIEMLLAQNRVISKGGEPAVSKPEDITKKPAKNETKK